MSLGWIRGERLTPSEIATNQRIAVEAHRLGFIGSETLAACQKFLSLGERTGISSDDFFLKLAGLQEEQLRLVRRNPNYLRGLPEFTPHIRLIREISRGGMGVVYQGWNERLQRVVAIKEVLPTSLNGPEKKRLLSRFNSEARAMASISHPSVVSVHEAGVTPSGSPYIVMEYVAGCSLAGILEGLKHGKTVRESLVPSSSRLQAESGIPSPTLLEVKQVVEWGIALADGLHACHLRGVMHRDVKPSNVLINEHAQPKLTDFGVALSAVSERVTRTGEAVGTPLYMAPECLLGKTQKSKAHPRMDVYSLGATLYEALTGSLPFKARGLREFYLQVYGGSPRPPRALRASIPIELEEILLKCLSRDTSTRYQSAAEVSEGLRALELDHAGFTQRMTELVKALIALAAVCASAGAGTALWWALLR